MQIKQIFSCLLLSVIGVGHYNAQETANPEVSSKGKLGISAVMGHAFIKHNVDTEKNKLSSAAALGVNVNYWIADKFAIGVHSDLIFESFVIEEKNGEEDNNFVEREYPLSVNAVATYKPIHALGLLAGVGEEFSKEKNLEMFLVGLEYMVELPHDWELGLSASYEVKNQAYDTLVFGLGVTRLFNLRKSHL